MQKKQRFTAVLVFSGLILASILLTLQNNVEKVGPEDIIGTPVENYSGGNIDAQLFLSEDRPEVQDGSNSYVVDIDLYTPNSCYSAPYVERSYLDDFGNRAHVTLATNYSCEEGLNPPSETVNYPNSYLLINGSNYDSSQVHADGISRALVNGSWFTSSTYKIQ